MALSQLAASTAADHANTTNSELHLITVAPGNPDPVYHIHEGSLRYETYQQALEAVKEEAQRVLDEQVRLQTRETEANEIESSEGIGHCAAWVARVRRGVNP